jgi:hypothetical protein
MAQGTYFFSLRAGQGGICERGYSDEEGGSYPSLIHLIGGITTGMGALGLQP